MNIQKFVLIDTFFLGSFSQTVISRLLLFATSEALIKITDS